MHRIPLEPREAPLESPNTPRRSRLLLVALLCCAATASAAPSRTAPPVMRGSGKGLASTAKREMTLVYGDDHVFGVICPNGWVIDDTSGLGQRIRVVLYPKGQSWRTASTVMYVNPIHQNPKARRSLRQIVDQDIAGFRKANPRGSVVEAPSVTSEKGKVALVRTFAPAGGKPTEAVAYYEEDTLVQLLCLNARDAGEFERVFPLFRAFAASYQYVGGGMQTPTMGQH